MTYFSHQSAARRYAAARPYFHPCVVGKIREHLRLATPLSRALDVGCGTGQSTLALEEIASYVVGADISGEMLSEAQTGRSISYVLAAAEQLPFAPSTFDLVTSGLAFHWFDRARFLPEAGRVLAPGGWLVIYNNVFTAAMRESPAFEQWVHDSYGARYPAPPRHSQPPDADAYGFEFVGTARFTNDVSFSPEELAAYMTTHSNVIAAVEQGTESLEEVYAWLLESARPFFTAPRCTFVFGNLVWFLRNTATP